MWWDPWRGFINGTYFPYLFPLDNENNLKDGNDSYHVYVNNEYVGDKESITQGEEGPSAIQGYLNSRGFKEFEVQMEGNRIDVQSDETQQSEDIKRHLSVYLSIR